MHCPKLGAVTAVADCQIDVANAPAIPALGFRLFRGESDYAAMAAVLTKSDQADQLDRQMTTQDLALAFTKYLTNCDPYTDMIIATIAGEMVGYARGWWTEKIPTMHLYQHNGFLVPEWRRKGIGRTMLDWMESRLTEIADMHPGEGEKHLQVSVSQTQTGTAVMLERANYQPVRYFFQMVRPNLDDIPDHPLPAGLKIRPVTADHYPAIWENIHESSQDEWGYADPTEEDYRQWLNHAHFQPHLWQIAWDTATKQVVGTVLTYIDHLENQQFGRKRGYTEGVGVSRDWRRRGVARALISMSLRAQKAAGMSESALVADSDSTSGVTGLFQSCGFEIINRDTIYCKAI